MYRDYQNTNRWRAFFASRAVLTIVLLFLIGMGIISFRALEAGWAAEAERAAVKDHLRELKEKKEKLNMELEDLRTEEGIEREARQKLNFRKPGEEVVIIRDTNSISLEHTITNASFWETIKQLFSRIMN
ncbi:MAG: hypothetical protein G01um101470_169 [Parcubacteria group bacterium Gr01-1014_70]|nr:MAG: hypothetical protein G01um101470_169 [Parcubacteria group bacterium Gr01-1014_70]